MKKTLFLIFTVILTLQTNAQSKNDTKLDKIILKNYEIIDCIISKISEKTIEYSLPAERLIYSLEIAKIAVINFANGKKQLFDNQTQNSNHDEIEKPSQKEAFLAIPIKINTIAVLPTPFVDSETQASSEEMAKFSQNDIYSKLMEKLSNIFPLTVQDIRDTNNLLKKANINYKNIDEIPILDLQKILGVDHVLFAKVSYNIETQQESDTFINSNVSINEKKKSINGNDFSTTTTNISKIFRFVVYFDLYKNNTKIYSQQRVPFFTEKDSWMDAMTYLLKRCPIYFKQ